MKITKKKNYFKKKSFYFQDYTETEYKISDYESEFIKVSTNRVTFLFFVFFSILIIFSTKIIYISLFEEKKLLLKNSRENFIKKRGDIKDRNGTILARNIDIFSAGIRPNFIKDKEKFLINLRLIFPNIEINEIRNKLKKKKFFYLKKRLTEEEKTNLWLLGNKAIVFEKKQFRIYPQQYLFSHIIGQIDEDNNGISGVEKFFDQKLKNKEFDKESLILSLDANLQYLIREELIKAQSDFKNIGSAAVLMNVENGQILSLISLPDYDLNQRLNITDKKYTNKITHGVYELGSVFKTFTLAAALENNLIKQNTVFKNLENSITCDKYKISEHDKLPKNLSAEQILIRSSNIGSVRIAQKIGIKKYKNFLNSLELLNTIDFDLKEVGRPIKFNWGKCKLATTSYGHGITTTPLQLARAYAILSNGGFKIHPTILKNKSESKKNKEQIISESTSKKITSILRKVVSLDEGTANFANIKGYDVAGKTGTAVKYNSNEKLNTFVSVFPSNNPKYVLLVILDEPKPAPNLIYKLPSGYKHTGEKRNTSGWNTVVVAGKIIEKIGPILAINNLQASKNF